MTEPALSDPRVASAIQTIWHEARLLDEKEYEAWERLYTDDALYVVPIDPQAQDFDRVLNMIYDNARMRRMRVERMIQGYAPSAVAAARTVRTISRFAVDSVSDDSVTLTAAQVLVAYKRGATTTLGANVTHRIAHNDGEAKIELKVVRLLNSDEHVPAAGYLL